MYLVFVGINQREVPLRTVQIFKYLFWSAIHFTKEWKAKVPLTKQNLASVKVFWLFSGRSIKSRMNSTADINTKQKGIQSLKDRKETKFMRRNKTRIRVVLSVRRSKRILFSLHPLLGLLLKVESVLNSFTVDFVCVRKLKLKVNFLNRRPSILWILFFLPNKSSTESQNSKVRSLWLNKVFFRGFRFILQALLCSETSSLVTLDSHVRVCLVLTVIVNIDGHTNMKLCLLVW